jgi:hypothetical protein
MRMRVVVSVGLVLGMGLAGRAIAEPVTECDPAALTAAITQANANGSGAIRLASDCVYAITDPATPSEAFPIITGDVTIIGGKNTTIARDPKAATQFRVVTVDAAGSLTLRKLSVEGGDSPGLGGGISNAGALTLKDVTFRNNRASNGAGFANLAGGTVAVRKSFFLLNSTTGVGGGAFINSGVVTVKKAIFGNNNAPINGGAVNTQFGGDTTISDSTFQFNTSGSLGGALSNLGTTRLERCVITRNTGSSGGATATGNEQVLIDRSVIVDNAPDNCSPLNTITGCSN